MKALARLQTLARAWSGVVEREAMVSGPVTPTLLKLAWPAAATSALQGLMAAVDVMMVGQLGEAAVAAVTASRQALMVVLVAGSAVAAGTGTLVAQAMGRDDRDEADHILTQGLIAFVILILGVLMPVGWFGSPWLMSALAEGDPEVVRLGVPYTRIVIVSMLFTMTAWGVGGALRGAGDTHTMLRLTIFTNIANALANYLLIFGLPAFGLHGLGVVGAAVGTAVARGIAGIALLSWLARGLLVLRLESPRHWRLDFPVLRAIADIGVPTSISSIALNLSGVLLISMLARTDAGRSAVAAYGLANMLRNFGTWVTFGLSEATMAMTGQNLGAGRQGRSARVGFQGATVAALFMLAVGVLMAAIAPWLLPRLLDEPDAAVKAQVIQIAVVFLLTQVIALPFLGVGMSLGGALRGVGDAVTPLVINLISLYGLLIPLAGLLSLDAVHLGPVTLPGMGWGPTGVWVGMTIGLIARGTLTWWEWRRRWRRHIAGQGSAVRPSRGKLPAAKPSRP